MAKDQSSNFILAEGEAAGKISLNDVRGLPDEFDRRTIQDLIDLYDKVFPYPHAASIDKLCNDMRRKRKNEQIDYNQFNELGKEMALRHTMCIPDALLQTIKVGYPNIIKDKMQYRWFMRKFPRFVVAEKL